MENIMSSKLFTTRQGTILLGVIAAVIAAVALIVYLQNYRSSVNKGAVPIDVLVAQKLIPAGTPGDVIRSNSGYYQSKGIAKSQVEAQAILSPATLAGQVSTTEISPGQQLTAADFGPSTGSVVDQLNSNQRAVVVPLGAPQEVGGQIAAGSHVDVWVSLSGQAGNGVTRPIVRELFQNMYVLAVSGGNVTLRANPSQAGTLIYAAQNAQMWLVLRPTVGSSQPNPPVIGSRNLIGH